MTDKTVPTFKPVQSQFRAARLLVCSFVITFAVLPPDSYKPIFSESYAQGGTLVIPQGALPKSGELKLDGHTSRKKKADVTVKKRPSPLPLRVTDIQREIISAKAKTVEVSVDHYILASALGSHYRPPLHRDLIKVLLMIYRELAAQGNNFNQIARQLNSHILSEVAGESLMDVLGQSMLRTQKAIRTALANGRLEPS